MFPWSEYSSKINVSFLPAYKLPMHIFSVLWVWVCVGASVGVFLCVSVSTYVCVFIFVNVIQCFKYSQVIVGESVCLHYSSIGDVCCG